MDEKAAMALGYIGALVVHVPSEGERVQTTYPFGGTEYEELREYAAERFERLWQSGPEPDGWGVHALPNGIQYQLLLRRVELPDLELEQ